MVEGVGRAEPDRTLGHRLGNEPPHLGHLGGGRLLANRRLLAHDGRADRRMPDQDGQIGVRTLSSNGGEVFGKGLELPIDPGSQRADVHALDDREVAHDQVAEMRRRRHDPETAIAGYDGRYAQRWRGRQGRVPGDLRVVMGMDVDDARHQGQSAGVDDFSSVSADLANGGDAPISDGDIGAAGIMAEPIDNRRAADHEIVHPASYCRRKRPWQAY